MTPYLLILALTFVLWAFYRLIGAFCHAAAEPFGSPVPVPLRVVCAWCGAEVSPGPETPVSHGICSPCADEWAKMDAE